MKRLTILVVEDDALQAVVLGELLEDIGHRVCALTATVAGALAFVERHRPALLVVDQWLKDGTGLSLTEKVCKNGHVPHLFATGDIARIKLARPYAVVIQKPYQVVELKAAIDRAMAVVPPQRAS
ncbi:MAG: response regulator [Aestuariivirga sp.]